LPHSSTGHSPGPSRLPPLEGAGSGIKGWVCRFVTHPLSHARIAWVGKGEQLQAARITGKPSVVRVAVGAVAGADHASGLVAAYRNNIAAQ
jgi:hypothetical protein